MFHKDAENLNTMDSEVFAFIGKERERQEEGLELIASENYTSQAVMQAQGSILTNKYAEGYPEKRYYGGCEFVDGIEQIAIDRAKELFGAKFANVQAHSGSQANMGTYFALLEPGDKVMGMDLAQGGHLTHGSPVNFSGKLYNIVSYGLDAETEALDYDQVEAIAIKEQPKLIVAGASAYARSIDFEKFRAIADKVGALLVVDMAHIAGLVAAGLHPNPVPHAHVVTSTTHKTLRGPRGGLILTNDEDIAKKINFNIFPGIQGGPLEHVIAAKAVAFKEALQPEYKVYQQNVIDNAKALAESLQSEGLEIVSNGTDNHLLMIKTNSVDMSGKVAEKTLEKARITCNKNMIPNDTRSPFVTSGIRIGTAAVTTRGLVEEDMLVVANLIDEAIQNANNDDKLAEISEEVHNLMHNRRLFVM